MDLPNLRTLTQAGGRMDPRVLIEYEELCRSSARRFITMYGQTEASPRIAFLPPEFLFTKPTSIGIPIPGGEIWLESDKGQVISNANVIGELVYKGPNVFLGYATDYTDLGKGDEQFGILRTGDLAERDKDGCYYIIGRLARFVKLHGHRINLLDVEVKLLEFGFEVLCSGRDDLLEIFVVSSDAAEGIEIKRIASHFLKLSPKSIIVYGLSDFPRGESGKVSYKKLSHESAVKLA
jgi:acyl-coenzyme A synthetase/AMP-(fatty) acid ligase